MQKAITATTDHIYLQVAGGIEKMIDEEVLKIGRASEKGIEFTRTNTWSKCVAQHQCEMNGANQLSCAIETHCPKGTADEVVWRGEERYARRASCERVEVRRAQGIPHRCS